MKKTMLGLLALTAVSSASAATYIGGSIGTGLTVHYQTDLTSTSAMRYGLNLDYLGVSNTGVSLGGGVDYLASIPSTSSLGGLVPYYGLGLNAGVSLGSVTGISVYPHGTLGLNYNLGGPLGVFVEGNAGPAINFSSGSSYFRFGYGAKLGFNYQIGN